MDKFKKDFMIIYLMRNALATLIITIFAFIYNFMNYFNTTPMRAVVKIFTDNLYTTAYFLLLWILNYLLFELYKIIIDALQKDKKHLKLIINDREIISFGSLVPLVILVVLVIIDFNQLFRINFILLTGFMLLRAIKEELKYRKNRLI